MNHQLSIREAAALLGVSEKTLRRWDASGKLRARRHPANNYRVYARQEIEALRRRSSARGLLWMLDSPADQRMEAIAVYNLAAIRHERGALSEARALYERAFRLFSGVRDISSEAICAAALAATAAAEGDVGRAEELRKLAQARAHRAQDPFTDELVELLAALMDAAVARHAALADDEATATDRRSAAMSVLRRADDPRLGAEGGQMPPGSEDSEDTRFVLRLLKRELDQPRHARGTGDHASQTWDP